VGAALGSLAAIIAILFTALYCCRRKRTKNEAIAQLRPFAFSGSDSDRNDLIDHVSPDNNRPAGWVIVSDTKMDIPPPAYIL
jgi:hypothetical protein